MYKMGPNKKNDSQPTAITPIHHKSAVETPSTKFVNNRNVLQLSIKTVERVFVNEFRDERIIICIA